MIILLEVYIFYFDYQKQKEIIETIFKLHQNSFIKKIKIKKKKKKFLVNWIQFIETLITTKKMAKFLTLYLIQINSKLTQEIKMSKKRKMCPNNTKIIWIEVLKKLKFEEIFTNYLLRKKTPKETSTRTQ